MVSLGEINVVLRQVQGVNNLVKGLATAIEDLCSRSKRIQRAEKNKQPLPDGEFPYDLKTTRKLVRQVQRDMESVQPKLKKYRVVLRQEGPLGERGKVISQITRGIKNGMEHMLNNAANTSRALTQTNFRNDALYLHNDIRQLSESASGM